jgi:hypothetical protein
MAIPGVRQASRRLAILGTGMRVLQLLLMAIAYRSNSVHPFERDFARKAIERFPVLLLVDDCLACRRQKAFPQFGVLDNY